jgi:hypothetical protein
VPEELAQAEKKAERSGWAPRGVRKKFCVHLLKKEPAECAWKQKWGGKKASAASPKAVDFGCDADCFHSSSATEVAWARLAGAYAQAARDGLWGDSCAAALEAASFRPDILS